MDDEALLAAFARDKSDEAFRELVRRYVGMVYSVCKRKLRDAHWAEDVTQAVFILLARKAEQIPSEARVGGWLYKAAMYACCNARHVRRTRSYHENLVTPMNNASAQDAVERAELEGLLDQGLLELNKAQREVLVLRFFEGRPLSEVARVRRESLYATHKKLDAGLARLRRYLAQRGVAVTAAVVAAVMLEQSARAVPAGLVSAVGSAALGEASGASAYVIQLASHLVKHAGRAKLLGVLVLSGTLLVLAVIALGLGMTGAHVPGGATPFPATGSTWSAADQARVIDALWGTLREAERDLRTMDSAALSDVVAFTDVRQAENWRVMARVFAADQALKQTAAARFGPDAQGLTAIKTFGQRLDEVLPQVDPESCQWAIGAAEAELHFGYRDATTAGGTLFFIQRDGRWKIDAGRSVDVVLEGLNRDRARAPMQDLADADQAVVLERMTHLEQALTGIAQRIESRQLENMAQARRELEAADDPAPGRAFFRLALRFDSLDQFRN